MWLDNHETFNRIKAKAMLHLTPVEAEEIRPKLTIYYTIAFSPLPGQIVLVSDTFTTNANRCTAEQAQRWVTNFLRSTGVGAPLDKVKVTGIWRDE